MFIYDREITEQLNSILKKTTYVSYIYNMYKHYFKIPFKRSYTKDTLLDILNDPKKFKTIIYKEIKDNIFSATRLININHRTIDLNKVTGVSLLESMYFYAFRNTEDGYLCIFLITNLLKQHLQKDEDLQKDAYIFTTFNYNTKVERNYKNRPYLQLSFTEDILKFLEIFKKELFSLGYTGISNLIVNFITIGL